MNMDVQPVLVIPSQRFVHQSCVTLLVPMVSKKTKAVVRFVLVHQLPTVQMGHNQLLVGEILVVPFHSQTVQERPSVFRITVVDVLPIIMMLQGSY